jgi:2-keto-3-deoxy-L-fuconate dehydrogenase
MYRMIRSFLPAMIEAGGGVIINVASVASSVIAAPNRFAYSATKAAVIGLTKSVAADFVTRKIRANAICPGTIDSPSLRERMRAQGDYEKARAQFISRQPMGRMGEAEEVATLAVYLASDESAFMTGTAIPLDGGWTNI